MPKADSCESPISPAHPVALAAKDKALRKLRLSGVNEPPGLIAEGPKVQASWQKAEGQLGQTNPYNLSPTQVLRGMIHCCSPTPAPVLPSSSREEEPKPSPFSCLPSTTSPRQYLHRGWEVRGVL